MKYLLLCGAFILNNVYAGSLNSFSGYLQQHLAYGYNSDTAQESLNSALFLDYNHNFNGNWKFKGNAKIYYDLIYDIKSDRYTQDELNAFRSQKEVFDAYIEGSAGDDLDIKLGRQVIVWGRSDNIRITDILNPLDNRIPGVTNIEDLRLPVTMARFDYFTENWRITPIVILEQRFGKLPPFGSVFSLSPFVMPDNESYNDITYALSIDRAFPEWDISLYAARIRDDSGCIPIESNPRITHEKTTMFGAALNIINDSWLVKVEAAYFDGLRFTSTQEKHFSRTDSLIGVEYSGAVDTIINYDFSLRHFNNYDIKLFDEPNLLNRDTYQHAFGVNSDFMNATLHINYLLSLYGVSMNKGGLQKISAKYDVTDRVSVDIGAIDYISGSVFFNEIKNQDTIFMNITYNF